MPTSLLFLPLLALSSSLAVSATPVESRAPSAGGFSMALDHTPHGKRIANDGTIADWLLREKLMIESKYGASAVDRRAVERRQSSTSTSIQNENIDASYSGSTDVGGQTFNLILDTGSSDLWVAGTECTSSVCNGITRYNPSSSSTFANVSTPFSITYGSGAASGSLARDTVTLASQTVTGQTFAVVTSTDTGLISSPLSGLMGLGFRSLATSNASPWWQTLSSNWAQPLFAFKLARYRGDATATAVEQNGGTVTFGALDSSLYTGAINWIPLSQSLYWQIPCLGVTVNGASININVTSSSSTSASSSGSSYPQSAIDTGTTLIAVDSGSAARIYAQIPNSRQVTQAGYSGYYEYPCTSTPVVAMNFGGVSYTINAKDFNIGRLTASTTFCVGAIYATDLGSTSPIQWIPGSSLLKNMYSIYRAGSSPAVGFAALADGSTVSTGTAINATGTTGAGVATPTTTRTSSAEARIGGLSSFVLVLGSGLVASFLV